MDTVGLDPLRHQLKVGLVLLLKMRGREEREGGEGGRRGREEREGGEGGRRGREEREGGEGGRRGREGGGERRVVLTSTLD